MIIAVAIMVLLPVGFVVFLIVANEICESESVVRGDKIDARVRSLASVLIQIGTASQPIRHLADLSFVAFPQTAHRITIFSVPFRPQDRKITDLIPVFPHVPWFRD